jgi:inner membrane protein
MHRSGHWGLAMLSYAPIVFGVLSISKNYFPLLVVGAVLVSGLCMLPDIDQRLPRVDHRGITHTIWFAVVVGVVLYGVGIVGTRVVAHGLGDWGLQLPQQFAPTTVGGFFGVVGVVIVLSHLVGDWMTKMGIRPYIPLSRHKHRLGLVYAKNRVANGVLYGVGLLTILGSFFVGMDAVSVLPNLVHLLS